MIEKLSSTDLLTALQGSPPGAPPEPSGPPEGEFLKELETVARMAKELSLDQKRTEDVSKGGSENKQAGTIPLLGAAQVSTNQIGTDQKSEPRLESKLEQMSAKMSEQMVALSRLIGEQANSTESKASQKNANPIPTLDLVDSKAALAKSEQIAGSDKKKLASQLKVQEQQLNDQQAAFAAAAALRPADTGNRRSASERDRGEREGDETDQRDGTRPTGQLTPVPPRPQ